MLLRAPPEQNTHLERYQHTDQLQAIIERGDAERQVQQCRGDSVIDVTTSLREDLSERDILTPKQAQQSRKQ